jgi:hypothetical protein
MDAIQQWSNNQRRHREKAATAVASEGQLLDPDVDRK